MRHINAPAVFIVPVVLSGCGGDRAPRLEPSRDFQTLPQEERKYWHPHNGEILSGQLVAPGLPQAAEKELMRRKMNSYGKTWHVWMTGQKHALPFGDVHLAWSFNREGEARLGLVEERDRRMDIDTNQIREQRQDLVEMARPQFSVDALKGKFGRKTRKIPGVRDIAGSPVTSRTGTP